MPSDPPPAIVTDPITQPVLVIRAWRAAVIAILVALAFVAVVVSALASSGCTSAQTGKPYTASEVVVVVREYAKATCVAVETPAAMDLATLTVPGYGPMAVVVARLVCAAFVNDPRAVAVRVETDGAVVTVPASGGEL